MSDAGRMGSGDDIWEPLTREDAVDSGWVFRDNGCGTITRALDDWIITSRELRFFMTASMTLANAHWARVAAEVAAVPAYAYGSEPADLYFDRLNGLMPNEYEWMLLSGVLRDAVTTFELYLMQAMDEVLRSHGLRRENQNRTPTTTEFKVFYQLLGLRPYAQGVAHVVRLRNVLSHGRGRLRSEKDRARYGSGKGPFSSDVAHLDEKTVTRHIETMDAATRNLDPMLWLYAWKRDHQIPRHLLVSDDVVTSPAKDIELDEFADLVPD